LTWLTWFDCEEFELEEPEFDDEVDAD